MKKVGFIIPGFRESSSDPQYQKIAQFFTDRDIQPIPIEVKWKRSTITQNLEYFLKIYTQTEADKKYVVGFSFGAVIAFLAATKISFDTIILCSLSPYFQEDLTLIKKSWITEIGTRRFKDLQQYNAKKLAAQIKAFTVLLCGGGEVNHVKQRQEKTYEHLTGPKKSIKMDKSVKHNLKNKDYLNEVQKLIMHLK